jgi:ATP-binding cassette subfamily F protein 3
LSRATDNRRTARRDAAQQRLALEPVRRESRRAADTAARLAAEQRALDRELAVPGGFGGDGTALVAALKRRADLARRIAEAEAQWLAAEEAIERAGRA